MKSSLPKVLHPVGGKAMLARVLETARALEPAAIHVVYNPGTTEVRTTLDAPGITWVAQHERLGTGHAVQQAMPGVPEDAEVLVLYGDIPLVQPATLAPMLERPEALTVLTMDLAEPAGYGRILRDVKGRVVGIVEERDADSDQRSITEVNSGIIFARAGSLKGWLSRLGTGNSQGEYYLTDVFAMAADEACEIGSIGAPSGRELQGANDQSQLAQLETACRAMTAERLMQKGVRIMDPERVELRGDIEASPEVVIDVGAILEGRNRLGEGVHVGPGCVLKDCDLGAGTRIHAYSVLEGVRTQGDCDIGPFARLRPGTELDAGCKVGNFVEIKQTRLGEGSKASHLSYLGDAKIGAGVNIGAGTITCNYDGANKHQTVIADGVFIGSDTQLVAPVSIGRNAVIGAGSTITRDTPEDQLTLSRSKQVSVPGWRRPQKGKKK